MNIYKLAAQPVKLKLINIQGLTKAKSIELQHLLEENTILCLTMKYNRNRKNEF